MMMSPGFDDDTADGDGHVDLAGHDLGGALDGQAAGEDRESAGDDVAAVPDGAVDDEAGDAAFLGGGR